MRALLTLLILMILVPAGAEAQRAKHRLADKHFQEYNFETAKEIYMNILRKHPQDLLAARRASECYRNMGSFQQGELLMAEVVKQDSARAEDFLLLADLQKRNKNYAGASQTYTQFQEKYPGYAAVEAYTANPDWAGQLMRDSIFLDVRDAGINSTASDFGPVQVGGDILFSSGRNEGVGSATKYAWNDQSYLNLFSARLTADSTLSNSRVLDNEANTRFHEGTVSYDAYNQTLYFTRNHFYKGKKHRSKAGTLRLAIYSARYENGEIGKLQEFPYNNASFSVGHPAVADSGEWIIFASDMPGGEGGTDLWKCDRDSSGGWGKPENMGSRINTPLDEHFPTLGPSGLLYFSSDGHPGLGGLDLFYVDPSDGLSIPRNFGYPANGAWDDFGILLFENSDRGFFSSNRPGGQGDDDIYAFTQSNPDTVTISGMITGLETGMPLGGVQILAMIDGDYTVVGRSNDDGTYTADVPFGEEYDLQLKKDGYELLTHKLAQKGKSAFMENVDWTLDPYEYEVSGTVTYGPEEQLISGATVILLDADGQEIGRTVTGQKGEYMLMLEPDLAYSVRVQKDGFMDRTVDFTTEDLNKPKQQKDLSLFKLEKGAIVRLDNIYYDYNSSHIREDAALELNKVVELMERNPTLRIELSSHTDSRGTATYNRWLSDRRAKNAADYIVSQGISGKRIVGKGYGEDKLINRCRNGVKCSEEEHQENRRTEFKVLDI